MAKQTYFQQSVAASNGPNSGLYLWSNPANWTNGLPVDGDNVTVSAPSYDDISALTIASLDETGAALVQVRGGSLTIANYNEGAGATLDAYGAGSRIVITGNTTGSGGLLGAIGPGAFFEQAGTDPGATYAVNAGGTVEVAATLAGGSGLQYGSVGSTFAFSAPGTSDTADIYNAVVGDVLELPGTTVSSVTFAHVTGNTYAVRISTNFGTTVFQSVTFSSTLSVLGYMVSHDAGTGLEAITSTNTDTFQQEAQAASGPYTGGYLWSNAANWTAGVPSGGGSVNVTGVGYDDIANLTLSSLTQSTGAYTLVATGGTLTLGGAGQVQLVASSNDTLNLNTTGFDTVSTTGRNNTVAVSAAALPTDDLTGGTGGDGTGNTLILTTTGTINTAQVSGFQSFQLAAGATNSISLRNSNFANLPGGAISVTSPNIGDHVDATALSAGKTINLLGTNEVVGLASGDTLGLIGGTGYAVTGSGDVIGTTTGVRFTLAGGNDTVYLGSGSTLSLFGGSGAQINASGAIIGVTANTNFSVAGGGNSIFLGNGSTLALSGGTGNSVNAASSTISAGVNTAFNLSGGNDTVSLDNGALVSLFGGSGYQVTGSGAVIQTSADTSFILGGGNDTLYLGAGASVNLFGGSGYNVTANSGVIGTTANTGFNLAGFNDTVYLGNGASVNLFGGSGSTVNATGATVGATANTDFTLAGGGDTVYLGNSDVMQLIGNASASTVVLSGLGDFIYGTSGQLSHTAFSNFAAGMDIDVTDLIPGSISMSYMGNNASGTLSLTDGTHTTSLRFNGSYNPGLFHTGADSSAGTLITYG